MRPLRDFVGAGFSMRAASENVRFRPYTLFRVPLLRFGIAIERELSAWPRYVFRDNSISGAQLTQTASGSDPYRDNALVVPYTALID